MIKRHGIIYKDINDVIDVLYQPETAKYLQDKYNAKTNGFKPSVVRDELKWKFSTHELRFFHGIVTIEAIPHEVMMNQAYLGWLLAMRKDKLLTPPGQYSMEGYLENLISDVKSFFGDQAYLFETRTQKIEEQPCYIWIWDESGFRGVFSGVPTRLLEGPLNPKITFDCSECDAFEFTEEDIVDYYYYDKDDGEIKYFCPKCSTKTKLPLKHVGE